MSTTKKARKKRRKFCDTTSITYKKPESFEINVNERLRKKIKLNEARTSLSHSFDFYTSIDSVAYIVALRLK